MALEPLKRSLSGLRVGAKRRRYFALRVENDAVAEQLRSGGARLIVDASGAMRLELPDGTCLDLVGSTAAASDTDVFSGFGPPSRDGPAPPFGAGQEPLRLEGGVAERLRLRSSVSAAKQSELRRKLADDEASKRARGAKSLSAEQLERENGLGAEEATGAASPRPRPKPKPKPRLRLPKPKPKPKDKPLQPSPQRQVDSAFVRIRALGEGVRITDVPMRDILDSLLRGIEVKNVIVVPQMRLDVGAASNAATLRSLGLGSASGENEYAFVELASPAEGHRAQGRNYEHVETGAAGGGGARERILVEVDACVRAPARILERLGFAFPASLRLNLSANEYAVLMAEAQPPALRRPLKTVRTLLLSPPEALDLRAQTLTLSAAAQRRGLKEIARACADEAWEPRVDAERWDVTPALNAVCRAQMLRLVKASIDVVDDFLVSRESQLWRDTVASYKG